MVCDSGGMWWRWVVGVGGGTWWWWVVVCVGGGGWRWWVADVVRGGDFNSKNLYFFGTPNFRGIPLNLGVYP